MKQTRILTFGIWLFLAVTLTTGFYVGDTRASHAEIDAWADGEVNSISQDEAGASTDAARAFAWGGVAGAERVAHWTFRHDGTFLGGLVELYALIAVWAPAAGVAYRDLSRVVAR